MKKSTIESSLSLEEARKMIARVNQEDRERARQAILESIEKARSQWISAHLIVEALSTELVRTAQTAGLGVNLAQYLRQLADQLEQPPSQRREVN